MRDVVEYSEKVRASKKKQENGNFSRFNMHLHIYRFKWLTESSSYHGDRVCFRSKLTTGRNLVMVSFNFWFYYFTQLSTLADANFFHFFVNPYFHIKSCSRWPRWNSRTFSKAWCPSQTISIKVICLLLWVLLEIRDGKRKKSFSAENRDRDRAKWKVFYLLHRLLKLNIFLYCTTRKKTRLTVNERHRRCIRTFVLLCWTSCRLKRTKKLCWMVLLALVMASMTFLVALSALTQRRVPQSLKLSILKLFQRWKEHSKHRRNLNRSSDRHRRHHHLRSLWTVILDGISLKLNLSMIIKLQRILELRDIHRLFSSLAVPVRRNWHCVWKQSVWILDGDISGEHGRNLYQWQDNHLNANSTSLLSVLASHCALSPSRNQSQWLRILQSKKQ